MDINIRLSLDAPRGWKHRVLLYVATPFALVAAASALAYAYDTNWIADKQPVSASALKGDLDEIQKRLNTLEAGPGTWHALHAAAAGACAAVSTTNNGTAGKVVAKPIDAHCDDVCASLISGGQCYASIGLAATAGEATTAGTAVGEFFKWPCNSPNGATEVGEVDPSTSPMLAYCCCYY